MVLAPAVRAEESKQLVFPGSEVFGKSAKCGRGGDVYRVIDLHDNGPGSLRYGIDTADNPRTIVFDVAGTIQLLEAIIGRCLKLADTPPRTLQSLNNLIKLYEAQKKPVKAEEWRSKP